MSPQKTARRMCLTNEGKSPQGTAGPALPDGQCRPPGGVTRSGAGGRQQGAALLLAMLTVALVATLASAALWQQWRSAEVEAAERQRLQASWILVGALDWARLILREDARSNQNTGAADHLGEPWATPLEEARLSSFLAADKNNSAEELMPAFLSGEMIDQQSRLNFRNLIRITGTGPQAKAELSAPDVATFTRLYALLDLPPAELTAAAANLLRTTERALDDPEPSSSPLVPKRYAQLGWLGLSRASLAALEKHVTVLPERSRLNLNTASAEALSASVPGLDLAMAQQVLTSRASNPFTKLEDAVARIPGATAETVTVANHDVRSRFFEARVRLRLDDTLIEEHSLIQRNGLTTLVLWRERVAAP
ncbi:type II secretion system minor pseudopilin GspK [Hydrogenophaga sp.]|uniref:type II secretion system minor pseudopilin GspK n=1 Tax=Hydrogenophaga sp. TaxID=1904254 RepID=UPI003BAE8F44